MEIDVFQNRMDEYIRMVKSSELAAGFDEIVMPVELEFRREKIHRPEGLTLGKNVFEAMIEKNGLFCGFSVILPLTRVACYKQIYKACQRS